MRTPLSLPDEQCRRAVRSEMHAIQFMLTVLSAGANVSNDLADRLKEVPHGTWMWRCGMGLIKSVCNDIVGTIPVKQAKQIKGVCDNYEIRLVPKLASKDRSIILDAEMGRELISLAQEGCRICSKTAEEAEKCQLFNLLTAITPLDDYDRYGLCPYNDIGFVD